MNFLENYLLLKQNTKQLSNVSCFNVGVGSRNSVVHFSDGDERNSGVVKVVDSNTNPNLVLQLDTLHFPEPISFIKIDIEGFELQAFEGMVDLLHRDKPTIWLEDLSGTAVGFLEENNYIIQEAQVESCDYLMKYDYSK